MPIAEVLHHEAMCTGVSRWDLGPEAKMVMDMKPFSPMCLYNIEGCYEAFTSR